MFSFSRFRGTDDGRSDDSDGDGGRKIIGVKALDRITGETFDIYAKHIIFAGGPFTDALRQKEDGSTSPVEPSSPVRV